MDRIVAIKDGFRVLLGDAKHELKNFKRTNYAEGMERIFQKHKGTVRLVVDYYTETNNDEATLDSLAVIFSEITNEDLKDCNKRQKSYKILDYNMGMVTYVMPTLLKEPSECMELLVDKIVVNWNETFKENQILKSNEAMIQGGFKKGLCYITTAVCTSLGKGDDCYELTTLRNFRDDYLQSDSESGSAIIKEYYNIAPTIVKRIDKLADSASIYRGIWENHLSKCIRMIENNQLETCKEAYTSMVKELKERYF